MANYRLIAKAVMGLQSKAEIARFSHIAERTTNFDAAALLHACATAQEVHSRLESSTA